MAELRRDLGLAASVSVVVGSMIGVGIFLGPRVIATYLPTPGLVLAVWILGGLFVFAGALSYAELGASFPRSGGPYAYIREAYGPLAGFWTGWSGFAFGKAASVSALAVAFAEFLPAFLAGALALLAQRFPGFEGFAAAIPPGSTLTRLGVLGVALTLILVLSLVNVFGVRHAGRLSVATMFVKVGALLVLVVAGIALLAPEVPALLEQPLFPSGVGGLSLVSAFGLALIPVFFAYDGWVNSTQVAEEVRDPARNVPRSVVLGTLGVVVVYALANLVYFMALGADGVGQSGAASLTATRLFGGIGGTLIVGAILVSIVGTINAVILSGPRIAYAMARDGVFPARVERVSRWGTPAISIALQGLIATALILMPPIGGQPLFETLLTYIIFNSFLFYGLGAGAVLVMRKRYPDLERPYKVPLYPIVPLIFIAGSALFLINTLARTPLDALMGIGLVLAATPIYWWSTRRRATPTTEPTADDAAA